MEIKQKEGEYVSPEIISYQVEIISSILNGSQGGDGKDIPIEEM